MGPFAVGAWLLYREMSFVKNVSEHCFTQGVVAIGGDRVSIAGRVKFREPWRSRLKL